MVITNQNRDISIIRKYQKNTIIFGISAILVLGIVDLQISNKVVNESSRYGIFLEDYGQIPGYIAVILALIVLLSQNKNVQSSLEHNHEAWNNRIIKFTVFSVFTIMIYIVIQYNFKQNFVIQITSSIILASLCSFIVFIFMKNRTLSGQYKYKVWAKITIWQAVITTLVITQFMKIMWGRVRYRDLNDDQSNYTPWYFINLPNGNYSFPSGHTGMGWLLLPLLVLTAEFPKTKRFLMNSIIVSWGILMAISRVIIGAHYVTDVLFSTLISIVCFLYLKYLFDKN